MTGRIGTEPCMPPPVPVNKNRKRTLNQYQGIMDPQSNVWKNLKKDLLQVDKSNDSISSISSSSSVVSSSSSTSSYFSTSNGDTSSGTQPHSYRSSSAPTKLSELQIFAMQRFTTSKPLTRDKLQASIRDLFIKMASEMSTKDPDATRDPKIALQLDPSDDKTKVKLLMILGKAHVKKNEFDAAMEYYEQGLKLENSNDYQKAYLYSCIGDIILRKKGDVDQAITNFKEGLKLQPDNDELTADLYLGLSKAYRLKSKPKNT